MATSSHPEGENAWRSPGSATLNVEHIWGCWEILDTHRWARNVANKVRLFFSEKAGESCETRAVVHTSLGSANICTVAESQGWGLGPTRWLVARWDPRDLVEKSILPSQAKDLWRSSSWNNISVAEMILCMGSPGPWYFFLIHTHTILPLRNYLIFTEAWDDFLWSMGCKGAWLASLSVGTNISKCQFRRSLQGHQSRKFPF